MVKGVIIVSEPEKIKVLADETRFKILHLLRIEPMSIGDLAMMLNKNRSTIYRNIKILEKAGFVEEIGKEGQQHVYARTARIFMIRPERDEEELRRIKEKYFNVEAETILKLLKRIGFQVENERDFVEITREALKEIDENSKEYLEKLRYIDVDEVEFLYLMNIFFLINCPKLCGKTKRLRELLKFKTEDSGHD